MTLFQKINFILTKDNFSKLSFFFLLMLLTVVFETLGVALILPAISFILDTDIKTNSEYLNFILSYFKDNYPKVYLIKITFILIFIIFLLKNLFLFLFMWWNKNFIQHIYLNTCSRLLKIEIQKSYLEHVESNSAIIVRNFNELKVFLKFIENFVILLVEGIILTILVLLLLIVNHNVAIIIFSVTIFLVGIFRVLSKKFIEKYGKERFYRSGQTTKKLIEILDNFKNIKVFNKEKFFFDEYNKNNFVYAEVNKKFNIIDGSPRYWLEFTGITSLCGMVLYLLYFGVGPNSILPILGMFSVAFYRIIPSVLRIVRALQTLNYDTPVIDQLLLSLKQKSDEQFKKKYHKLSFLKNITLLDLSFTYSKNQKKIINDINLEIKKGDKIGIIGKSGIGKSTLVDLILGLLNPTKGNILVDGKDIRENLKGWRDLIGYVPQKINVIDGSFKDNIIFGYNFLENSEIEIKLKKIIKITELEDFIKNSKNGIHTIIGDKGLDLSGGQLQRLAMARALFKNPEILILDESTNALDELTEKKIINNLIDNKNEQYQSIITISHNRELLKFCDKIYEIKNQMLHKIDV
jgi:ATP-binding cassette, subfamily B, bacterial PglK